MPIATVTSQIKKHGRQSNHMMKAGISLAGKARDLMSFRISRNSFIVSSFPMTQCRINIFSSAVRASPNRTMRLTSSALMK
jgi:hypothetical protein